MNLIYLLFFPKIQSFCTFILLHLILKVAKFEDGNEKNYFEDIVEIEFEKAIKKYIFKLEWC